MRYGQPVADSVLKSGLWTRRSRAFEPRKEFAHCIADFAIIVNDKDILCVVDCRWDSLIEIS